jgi:hypothetical protein
LRAWRSPRSPPRARAPWSAFPRADVSDPKALIAALNTAFEEFKTTHEAAARGEGRRRLLEQKITRSTRR